MKRLKIGIAVMAAMMIIGNVMPAYAGVWTKGVSKDAWWYDNGDGTFLKDGWHWVDGNNDGVAECYYFDNSGWMLSNTKTPDGYDVNTDGAWVVNGMVQTKSVQATNHQTQNTTVTNSDAPLAKYIDTYDLRERTGTITNVSGLKRMKDISFNDSHVDDLMPVKQITNPDGTVVLQDEYKKHFEKTGSNYYFYLTKEILEKALRKSGFNTPIANGNNGKIIYSTRNLPVYSKGVKKGNIDAFGLTGPIGGTAKKTVYGEGVVTIEIPKEKENGNHVTVRDVVKTLYDWYKENPIYTFGGMEDYYETTSAYVFELYVGNKMGHYGYVATVNGEDIIVRHDGYVATVNGEDIIVRAIPWIPKKKNNLPKYVYVTYKPENGNYNAFGEYTNFEETTNGISADLVPDVVVSPVGKLNAR